MLIITPQQLVFFKWYLPQAKLPSSDVIQWDHWQSNLLTFLCAWHMGCNFRRYPWKTSYLHGLCKTNLITETPYIFFGKVKKYDTHDKLFNILHLTSNQNKSFLLPPEKMSNAVTRFSMDTDALFLQHCDNMPVKTYVIMVYTVVEKPNSSHPPPTVLEQNGIPRTTQTNINRLHERIDSNKYAEIKRTVRNKSSKNHNYFTCTFYVTVIILQISKSVISKFMKSTYIVH